jgi:hypothetical protein
MNRPITLLLAVVVLAHSLAGCCSHHAHASVPDEVSACSTHEHCHEHGASEDGTKSDPSDQPCDESSCVFVRGESSQSIELTLNLALDCCVLTADEVGLDSLRIARASYPDSQELAPHTRLHLLHQILLI